MAKQMACCSVDAVITIDGRGQIVLPKDVREKAGMKAGDKLAVVSWTCCEDATCVALVKADTLATMAKDILGPIAEQMGGNPGK